MKDKKNKQGEIVDTPVVLGRVYRDAHTGFTGVATSVTKFLNGCVQIGIEPKVNKDGEMTKVYAFDDARLVDVEAEKMVVSSAPRGGAVRHIG